ncbi:MAG: Nif3-like dinuclear metal center hexameric protein [Gemmatimonadota bacterium]|nr:Nif3-like dinuclear metal center hexameric protein [Gemmatimonadota bacterium]
MTDGSGEAAVARDALVAWLDEYLDLGAWRDKSLNGLQVEGSGSVSTVATAVDAAMATFAMAEEAGAELLLVHHGIFWGSVEPIVGIRRERIAALLDAGLSLYAAHLPLDAHPEVGNNAILGELLELRERQPFGEWDGEAIGVRGRLSEAVDREGLAGRLEALLGARPDVLPFGPERIERVGVVSGDAAGLVDEAAAVGLDAFVTGESSHVAWHAARERSMNLYFAGHYATETLGVRALGERLSEVFGVEVVFLDAPTGY